MEIRSVGRARTSQLQVDREETEESRKSNASKLSFAEVSTVLSEAPGVLEANVYGVKVFEQDGRAGMAALVIDPAKFSWESFYQQ